MTRALVAGMMLLMLSACGATAPQPVSGKPSPAGPPPPPMPEDAILCTADVRLCPDGSTVSRNPAKGCAFNACPGAIGH
ncbi:MAG: hypothetical protein QG662_2123 [Pseudomonadota bacterium]|nr:hypothetical protein [Pseudomonadota bacterium]